MDKEIFKKINRELKSQEYRNKCAEREKFLEKWRRETFWLLKKKGLFKQYKNYREYKKARKLKSLPI